MYKVDLCNSRAILARVGYGEGDTHQEAIDNALAKAREQDPNARYVADSNTVVYSGIARL